MKGLLLFACIIALSSCTPTYDKGVLPVKPELTGYPYEWDTLTTNHCLMIGGDALSFDTKTFFQFNEEYILCGMEFTGHWTSEHKFICDPDQGADSLFVSPTIVHLYWTGDLENIYTK